ncbi:MAG: hypothetical protein UY91_C0024G0006 [Parcubacteria group bacterium GW2011_GWB1_55_9]|nr:MAG: hypothetical protein UY91_C0024G0006 [Parcubacteria group bacterium GW2011_GWB1_55_9]
MLECNASADCLVGRKFFLLHILRARWFFTSTTPLAVILIVLVGSRVGSALIESMVEAHFFRRISKRDINSVSVFRGVWPLSYIIGPVVGSVILLYGDYTNLFLITGGFIAVAGVVTTLLIRDFR